MMVFSSYRSHESRGRLEQESTSSCVKHYRNSISLDWSWKFRARPFLQSFGLATSEMLCICQHPGPRATRIQPLTGINGWLTTRR